MEAREQLVRLLWIQGLALKIGEAEATERAAPGRIEVIEERFRERNAEYVALRNRNDELAADQRLRSGELTDLEEKRKKFMDDLMQVKNQREYSAMLKEIDSVKAQISEHEDAILRDMEEIERLTGELATHAEHIKSEREAVSRERAAVEAEADEARTRGEALRSERQRVESELPALLRTALMRLEARRQGVFLSKVDDASCESCYVRVRPQVFQEIKMATEIHTCSNCRRYLYHEPTLRPLLEQMKAGDGVEAMNGGAA